MSFRKEMGSKQRKNIISAILTPGISSRKLENYVQFVLQDEKKNVSYLLDKEQHITFFSYEKMYLPTLKFIRKHTELEFPSVQVDEGAVKFVINGADIFSQGIVNYNREFSENTIVTIMNPQNSVLSIGKCLFSSRHLLKAKGKSIINLHYLGDKIWEESV
ncbi:MAG: PUA domain-containing protein [Candidatus Hodarchaeales archaeon]|jgi:PUA domain protein